MATDEIDGDVCIEYIKGQKINSRRGLAWLIAEPTEKEINAKHKFTKLREKRQNDLRNRFDYWLDGNVFDKYFHGWNEPDYRDCFVFKIDSERFFGFLCHPKQDDLSYVLCVIATHSTKDGWEADKTEKNRMNQLKKDVKILEALKNIQEKCQKEQSNDNETGLDRTKS